MIPWFRALLYDPQTFANVVRALLFLGAELLPQMVDVGATGWWVAKVCQAGALLIRAGDRNLPGKGPADVP